MCVCVCVCVGGGGHDPSIMTPLFATVSRVSSAHGVGQGGGGGGQWLQMCFIYSHNACWYMRALYNNGNEDRRLIKMSH